MNATAIFWMQILISVVVGGVVSIWYIWPSIKRWRFNSALTVLLFAQVPRYVGMVVLVPYMVDTALPGGFLASAAYGDLAEAALAFLSIFALRNTWRIAIPLVWITNIWGLVDLLNGLRSVIQLNVPSFDLGTLWYIYIFYAPVVLLAHIISFRLLIIPKGQRN